MDTCDQETCACLLAKAAVAEENIEKLHDDIEALETGLADETAAREAADDTIQTEIDGLNVVDTDFNTRITSLESDVAVLQETSNYYHDDIRNFAPFVGVDPGTWDTLNATTAIMNAMSSVGSAFVPPGLWYIRTQIVLNDGDWLRGGGWESTELRWNDDNGVIGGLGGSDAIAMLRGTQGINPYPAYETRRQILVEGIHFNGNSDNNTVGNTHAPAIEAITLYGEDHTIKDCKFSGFRAGTAKECFVVNLSGTYIAPDYFPAKNCHVINCLFCEGGEQPNGTTVPEFSQILIAGYPSLGAAPEEMAIDCSVEDCLFRDLVQNGTTHKKLIQCVSVFGKNIRITGNDVRDCTGDVKFINIQFASAEQVFVEDNYYEHDGGKFLLGFTVGAEYHKNFYIRRNRIISSTAGQIHYNHANAATGGLSGWIVEGNFIDTSTSAASASQVCIVFESRKTSLQGVIKITNNFLIKNAAASAHVAALLDSTDGVTTAVTNPENWIVGDNYDETGARALRIAYRDSSANVITWAVNPDFPNVT